MASGQDDSEDLIRRADAGYRGFAGFGAWSGVPFDEILWDDARALLDAERVQASTVALGDAVRVALREAALTTGAIEDLYRADRGFTFSVAAQIGTWESDLEAQGPHVRRLFEAQLAALELVVDAATRRVPITEKWIRELHAEICREQETYDVRTPLGLQPQVLPKGEYKRHPNHVRLKDGSLHSYSPVEQTGSEIHRLVTELEGAAFAAAHPVVQAAYAHHAFVSVHPFADGNGRVARALGSVFTYRASSIPLVVYTDQTSPYFDSLAAADREQFGPFVAFVLNVSIDTLNQLAGRLRAARATTVSEAGELVGQLYAYSSSPDDHALDVAATRVATVLRDEVSRQLAEARLPRQLSAFVQLVQPTAQPRDADSWRHATGRPTAVLVELCSAPPAVATAGLAMPVVVSRDAGSSSVLRIEGGACDEFLRIRRDHVDPIARSAFRSLLSSWISVQLSALMTELEARAAAVLRSARP